jgi:hypothetical protein
VHGMNSGFKKNAEDGWMRKEYCILYIGKVRDKGGEVRVQRDFKEKRIEIQNTTQIILYSEG